MHFKPSLCNILSHVWKTLGLLLKTENENFKKYVNMIDWHSHINRYIVCTMFYTNLEWSLLCRGPVFHKCICQSVAHQFQPMLKCFWADTSLGLAFLSPFWKPAAPVLHSSSGLKLEPTMQTQLQIGPCGWTDALIQYIIQ